MKISPARWAAFAFLEGERWLLAGDWDEQIDARQGDARLADPRDRRLFLEIVSGCVRLRARLDARLKRLTRLRRLDDAVAVAMRVALYQMEEMDRIPAHAAIGESVEWVRLKRGRKLANWTNAQLRNLQREGIPGEDPDPAAEPLRFAVEALSYPEWLASRWIEELGTERAFAVMVAMNRHHGTWFRWNARRAGFAALLGELEEAGVEFQRAPLLPNAFRIPGAWPDRIHQALAQGYVSVQDLSSQRLAPLLAAGGGANWADLCAAPGGKSCHLAEIAPAAVRILALDRSATRLEKVVANAQRLGLSGIEIMRGDLLEVVPRPSDGVLLDAPCSALGVLGQNPDARWRRSPEQISNAAAAQRLLLAAATAWVNPGGRLLYSVCTVSPEETVSQRKWFLESFPEYTVDAFCASEVPEGNLSGSGELFVWPDDPEGGAGTYAARFRRRG